MPSPANSGEANEEASSPRKSAPLFKPSTSTGWDTPLYVNPRWPWFCSSFILMTNFTLPSRTRLISAIFRNGIGSAFSLLLLISFLGHHSVAKAALSSCESLFVKQGAQTLTDKIARFSELDHASQEYITRLIYLFVERPMLQPQTLKLIMDSPQPMNPFNSRPLDVTQYPHFSAFAELLEQPLQWKAIQQAAADILGAVDIKQERKQTAKAETNEVLTPHEVQNFPFHGDRLVVTSKGQVFAIQGSIEWANENPITTIKAFDLASSQQTASVSYQGEGKTTALEAFSVGESVFVTLPNHHANVIATVDLLNQKVLPFAQVSLLDEDRSRGADRYVALTVSYLINDNGQPVVIAAQEKKIHAFNALTGEELAPKIITSENGGLLASGVIGNTFYYSKLQQSSLLLTPPNFGKAEMSEGLKILTAFEHSGQKYALGIDVDKGNYKYKPMRLMNLETQKRFPKFTIFSDEVVPVLVDQFEQDGILYGVIAASHDVFVVDLMKGQIKNRLSRTPNTDHIELSWDLASAGQVGFTHKGRRYVIGKVVKEKVPPFPSEVLELVVLDALTLEPVIGTNYPAAGGITGVRRIPTSNNEIKVLINFWNGTSRVLSMVKRS